MEQSDDLRVYRFAIENLYRQQEHVLDEAGEKLMSLSSRLASAPNDAYWALSTADAKFPTITLASGEQVTVSYGQYRALLATRREQSDRETAFTALARDVSGRRRTRTRRSTTASASATGSMPVPGATRARSTRRSTATTFPRPWSRT